MLAITIPILLYTLATFTIVLALLTGYLFWQKGQHKRFLTDVDRYITKYERSWYDIFINHTQPTVQMLPKSRAHFVALERIFLMYLKHYNTSKIKRAVLRFANDYMTAFYEKELMSRSWSRKMNALYRIYDFRLVALLRTCEKINFEKLDDDMQLQLFKIFAIMSPKRLFQLVVEQQHPLSEMDYKQLFMLLDADSFQQLITHFDELRDEAKVSLIDTSYMQQKLYVVPLLEQLLRYEQPEIRIRTLKALLQFKHVPSISLYSPFVTSDVWEERMIVAKILRYFPLEQTVSYLMTLLEDQQYSVRLEASRTFASSSEGERWLQRFLTTSNDKYAIDMVNATLTQKKVSKL